VLANFLHDFLGGAGHALVLVRVAPLAGKVAAGEAYERGWAADVAAFTLKRRENCMEMEYGHV
jgi:hypothetical protein